jgi:hypothetical protein
VHHEYAELPAPNHEALDRAHLLERLHELRMLVPAFAEELASARRQAAALRVERRRLLERVAQLQRDRSAALESTAERRAQPAPRPVAPALPGVPARPAPSSVQAQRMRGSM